MMYSISDVVVVHIVMNLKILQFPNGEKVIHDSSRKVKQQFVHRRMRFYLAYFEQNILSGHFQLHHLTAKYKCEKVLLNKYFSNFMMLFYSKLLCLVKKNRVICGTEMRL